MKRTPLPTPTPTPTSTPTPAPIKIKFRLPYVFTTGDCIMVSPLDDDDKGSGTTGKSQSPIVWPRGNQAEEQ